MRPPSDGGLIKVENAKFMIMFSNKYKQSYYPIRSAKVSSALYSLLCTTKPLLKNEKKECHICLERKQSKVNIEKNAIT